MRSFCGLALLPLIFAPVVSGAPITVYGGPAYNATAGTGYWSNSPPVNPGSTAGNAAAVGWAEKYSSGKDLGARAVRWDASGAAAELGNLGTTGGSTRSIAYAINNAGAAVGSAEKYSGSIDLGKRAVRWDAVSAAAIELGNLGTDRGGSTTAEAYAINSAGVAVGYAFKYSGLTELGDYRAVRWDASGAATELGNLGTDINGFTTSYAYAISSAGSAIGYAEKYSGGMDLGARAVRWEASSAAANELGNLGADSSGFTASYAYAINSAGAVAGIAASSTSLGYRAVRWDAFGAVTELDDIGTDSSGRTFIRTAGINSAGTVVGYAYKYSGGTYLGLRAVRWDPSGAAATELGNLGTNSGANTNSQAYAINSAGAAVGYADKYSGNTLVGSHAVLWTPDGVAIDLNTLIDPASGWTLTEAIAISDTNWVTGIGKFDPDGPGPLSPYQRAFLIDVSSAIPEPAELALLGCASTLLIQRRRQGRRNRRG